MFDMNCNWPMYREPYKESFLYKCGLYQQSGGGQCAHNHVDGPTATRFVLSCIRQRLLSPTLLPKVKQRLEALAAQERTAEGAENEHQKKQAELAKTRQDIERVSRNMALAETSDQYRAMAAMFDELGEREQALAEEQAKRQERVPAVDRRTDVEAALGLAERLAELAANADDLKAARQVFELTNVRLFLAFRPTQVKKRTLNKLVSGIVTFGAAPPPINIYKVERTVKASETRGPEDCRSLQSAIHRRQNPTVVPLGRVSR